MFGWETMIYNYKCSKCGKETETAFHMGKAPSTVICSILGCAGTAYRRYTIPNLNNVNRFGTRSKRDKRR
jgi:hypothetical protein